MHRHLTIPLALALATAGCSVRPVSAATKTTVLEMTKPGRSDPRFADKVNGNFDTLDQWAGGFRIADPGSTSLGDAMFIDDATNAAVKSDASSTATADFHGFIQILDSSDSELAIMVEGVATGLTE